MRVVIVVLVLALASAGLALATGEAEAKPDLPCLVGPWYSGCIIPSCDPGSPCCGPECMPP